ncbi:MAG: helix-turn-helix transcriptional regulator [Bacteroidales bacterium]|nr:helix-turn-helix transcriptional regulator [Bacteroidales bacterium]
MLFTYRIKELGERKQMVQRQFAAALEIDITPPMYSEIECGDCRDKREQITIIARLLQIDDNELAILWFADKFIAIIGTEKDLAPKAFKIALKNVNDN